MRLFSRKRYDFTVVDGIDDFTLKKYDTSDWVTLTRNTHGKHDGQVEFRSREALLMVKHMIDDLLREDQY